MRSRWMFDREEEGMKIRQRAWSIAAVALVALQGCASVTAGNRQDVQVVATAAGQNIDDADCELSNDKGRWLVSTPATVEIQPSFQDLSVRCVIASHEAGAATFKSSVGAPVFGNIVAGGIVGAIVDSSTGAAFRYPDRLTVALGPATGKPLPPKPKVVPIIEFAPGDVLEYAVVDRFSGNRRIVSWTVDSIDNDTISFDGGRRVEDRRLGSVRRASPTAGDMEQFEPPQGWFRWPVTAGSGWQRAYEVADGAAPARVTWSAYVEGEEEVLVMGRRIRTLLVEYRGSVSRHAGVTYVQHRLSASVWVEPTTRRIIRFDSSIQATVGGSRPSRELVELVRHVPAGATAIGPARGMTVAPVAKAAPAIDLAPGDVLEYAIVDRFTGNRRLASWTIDSIDDHVVSFDRGRRVEDAVRGGVRRTAATAGDMEHFEPPEGWFRWPLTPGTSWTGAYEVADGPALARLDWRANVEREEEVLVMGRRMRVLIVEFRGGGTRSSGATNIEHKVNFTAWVEPTTRRIVRFESSILASGGAQAGQSSRELIELVRHTPRAAKAS